MPRNICEDEQNLIIGSWSSWTCPKWPSHSTVTGLLNKVKIFINKPTLTQESKSDQQVWFDE